MRIRKFFSLFVKSSSEFSCLRHHMRYSFSDATQLQRSFASSTYFLDKTNDKLSNGNLITGRESKKLICLREILSEIAYYNFFFLSMLFNENPNLN